MKFVVLKNGKVEIRFIMPSVKNVISNGVRNLQLMEPNYEKITQQKTAFFGRRFLVTSLPGITKCRYSINLKRNEMLRSKNFQFLISI